MMFPLGRLRLLSALFLLVVLTGYTGLWAQNPQGWGRCEPTPTVVHPAVVSPLQRVLSLRGEWEFQTDPEMKLCQTAEKGRIPEELWDGARMIQVPGCWEAQGVGEPGMSHTWDCLGDCNPRPLHHVYMGCALYRKQVEIPAFWKDAEIWLKVGGVRTEARFWVNGVPIGRIDNFCGTYKFDVSEYVTPGQTAEIVAAVRNDLPSRKGQMTDFHCFGGFYRDIELEATPKTRLDDVWVQGQITPMTKDGADAPDFQKTARVHIALRTVRDQEETVLKVRIKTLSGQTLAEKTAIVTVTQTDNKETVLDIPVENAALWSPESPTLYLAEATIQNADGTLHGWTERFGFRSLTVVGNRFFFNGRPYFMRGYGETFIYPLTLVSPADQAEHRKNMALVKESGFNQTRMHTHCEIPEFFEAADEAGILIQPELPYYTIKPTESFPFDPIRDIEELYRHYRRYTSFAFYTTGNEGSLGSPLDREIYEWVKKNDSDRPIQHQDGGKNTPENSDYGSMPYNVWPRGQYDDAPYPFIAHEYLNLTVKLDPRLENLFTGAIPSPVTMADYRNRLARHQLSRSWGDACIRAAHALQAYYQKAGLESARLDPACDGYNFWNFVDQMVIQGPAWTSQGYLNAFYQVKDGGITPKEFAEFNSPTAILTEIEAYNDVFVGGDSAVVNFWISHFGDAPLPSGTIDWTLERDGETISEGTAPFETFAVGDVRQANRCEIPIPELDAPATVTLRARITGTDVMNHWVIRVFPKRSESDLGPLVVAPEFLDFFRAHYENVLPFGDPNITPDAVLIAPPESESYRQGVAEGRRILAIRPAEGNDNVNLGWWSFGPQLGTAFAEHPAFGNFPHSGHLDLLWFRMVKDDPLDLAEAPGVYEPLAVGETVDGYSLYVGERQDGSAKILATFGLDLLKDTPETVSLLDQFLRYLRTR